MSKYILAFLAADAAIWSYDHQVGGYAIIASILLFFVVGVFRSTPEN